MPRTAAAATTALLVLLLGACSSGGDTSADDAPSSADARDSQAGDAPEAVELPTGLSFAAPEGWDEISAETVSDVTGSGEAAGVMEEMASRMGMTADQLRTQVESLDVFIAAPHAEDGFLSNINATHVDSGLPTEGSVELQYRGLGGKDIEVEPIEAAGTDALLATYTLPMASIEVRGGAILVEHDGVLTVLTISTGTADATAQLADDLVDSLAVID